MSSANKGLHQTETIEGRKPRFSALENDPRTQAVVSKLVEGTNRGQTQSNVARTGQANEPDPSTMQRIAEQTATNVNDSKSLLQLLPDLELAMQILVSSILSPNDMVSTEVNFSVEGEEVDSDLVANMLKVVRDYFENTYKIKKIMPDMLKDALFYKGSYPMAIVPESSVDNVINQADRVSHEDIKDVVDPEGKIKTIGILGDAQEKRKGGVGFESVSVESFQAERDNNIQEFTEPQVGHDEHLYVTDNPAIMKMPLLESRVSEDRLKDRLARHEIGMESSFRTEQTVEGQSAQGHIERMLYQKRQYSHVPVVPLRTLSELENNDTYGHPLVMTLPAESVIPVHVPGNPDEHIGYFVMLDETGNPVNKAEDSDYYRQMGTNLRNSQQNQVSQMIGTTMRGTMGNDESEKYRDTEELTRMYTDMVEADLVARLKNGIYGNNVKIARPQEVYRIMMARSLANMYTRLLYIPESLMTYIAFDYNEYGVGKSLLEQTKIIGSIRAMLLFANTMAQIKNSVGRVQLNIELDEEDPDPADTVEKLVHEYARTRQRTYPIGESNPVDIVDYLQNAGIEVAVEGNTGYPTTKMDAEDKATDKTVVDQDLDEALKKRHISGIGLAPETVDLSMDVDFATSVVSSNIQLTKRVMVYQNLFEGHLNDFVRKYVPNSGHLMDRLRRMFDEYKDARNQKNQKTGDKENNDDEEDENYGDKEDVDPEKDLIERYDDADSFIMDFLQRINVELPSPNTIKLENQVENYEMYTQALDLALEAYINEDMLDQELLGELADGVRPAKEVLRAYFKRQWLRNNNFMPELEQLVMTTDEDREKFDLLEVNNAHLDAIRESIGSFLENAVKNSKESDKDLEAARSDEEEEEQR